jgi:hypothetical protein
LKIPQRHLGDEMTAAIDLLRRETTAKTSFRHGHSRSPEHNSWRNMKERCYRPEHNRFKYYGARGIQVCERWRNSFLNFLADMGPTPTPKHSIDRIDNDGDYEPSNCHWATTGEQASHRRPLSAEARAGRAARQRGKRLSAEHRAKIGAALIGRECSAETRAKISAANKLAAAKRATAW